MTLGATADPQYNLSGITSVGQQNEKPIITGEFQDAELTSADIASLHELSTWSVGLPANPPDFG